MRVLVAEDEPAARDLISAVFDAGGWHAPVTAHNGVEALERLRESRYDILLTDLNMPRLGGEELVRRALDRHPDLTVIVLTGNGSIPKAVDLLREGVFDFLTKPFSVDQLLSSLGRARERVLGLSETRGMREVLAVLLKALESKDPYLQGHSERVARTSIELGRKLGLGRTELEFLGYAALMHDIGKIGIREDILVKETPLEPEEFAQIRHHPIFSRDILSPVTYLRPCLPAVLHHHERWQGGGYPTGVSGAEIPFEARIIAVTDAYDAMTSHRSYRRALPPAEALRRLENGSGTQFDPVIVESFIAHHDEIVGGDPVATGADAVPGSAEEQT
jgi:HD-GYP domain-containing protein (c-di-GMP phosphodiesterase class II)